MNHPAPSRLSISSEQRGEVLIAFRVLNESKVPEVFFEKSHASYFGDGKPFAEVPHNRAKVGVSGLLVFHWKSACVI
jgi:hypothetical protein